MNLYATPADLNEWLGKELEEAQATALLRNASVLVRRAIRLAIYRTDEDGNPTEPHVIEALKCATLQQATTWEAAGIDPDKGETGQAAHVQSQSVEGGSVTYSSAQSTQELGAAATTLTGISLDYLANAGLLEKRVAYWR